MAGSVNGNKFNTPQWSRNDEVENCSSPEGAPGSKVNARPQTFCDNVTIEGDLVVSGNVTISGTLTVAGTITAPYFDGLAKAAETIG
tara:strand:+ start:184 stop:444 length:261 start_codon:yes stop_codon:yes gene_type:complete